MNYPSIRIEGAILSPDILDRIEDLPGQKPADFGLESSSKVKDEIARAWADAQDYWRIFQRKLETLKPDSPATTETRQQWVVPLLGLLGYQLEYQARGTELNGKLYSISHRATNRAQAPVQIVGYREPAGLDRKPGSANVRMSAHAMVQEFINLNEQLYGLVTNGRVLAPSARQLAPHQAELPRVRPRPHLHRRPVRRLRRPLSAAACLAPATYRTKPPLKAGSSAITKTPSIPARAFATGSAALSSKRSATSATASCRIQRTTFCGMPSPAVRSVQRTTTRTCFGSSTAFSS